MNRWSLFFDQLRDIGKHLVKDDLHDFGYFKYFNREGHKDHPGNLHHWQYGTIMWAMSEYLSLLNIFFPFDKELRKRKMKINVERLKARARRKGKSQKEVKVSRLYEKKTRHNDMKDSLTHSFQVYSK